MVINDDKSKKDRNLIISTLRFKKNIASHSKSGLPIVLVEGPLDKTFYDDHKQDNVEFICINEIAKYCNLKERDEFPCNNVLITEVIYGLKDETFNLKELKGDFYGVIDRDFETDDSIVFQIPNLFVTDTHDLETMLLSTDAGLLERMGIILSKEDFEKATVLCYELALIRKELVGNEYFKIKHISNEHGDIPFQLIIEDGEIHYKKILDLLNSKKEYPFEQNILQSYIQTLVAKYTNIMTDSGKFALSASPFKKMLMGSIWKSINGHDFCSAIRYINTKAAQDFPPSKDDNKRYMETEMVLKYDFSKFKTLNISKKMREAALLRG